MIKGLHILFSISNSRFILVTVENKSYSQSLRSNDLDSISALMTAAIYLAGTRMLTLVISIQSIRVSICTLIVAQYNILPVPISVIWQVANTS